MANNIYRLLNEIETDFSEYEKTELSSKEKEEHKQRILMEVKRMKKRNENGKENRKARVWKTAAGAAAACVICCIIEDITVTVHIGYGNSNAVLLCRQRISLFTLAFVHLFLDCNCIFTDGLVSLGIFLFIFLSLGVFNQPHVRSDSAL